MNKLLSSLKINLVFCEDGKLLCDLCIIYYLYVLYYKYNTYYNTYSMIYMCYICNEKDWNAVFGK